MTDGWPIVGTDKGVVPAFLLLVHGRLARNASRWLPRRARWEDLDDAETTIQTVPPRLGDSTLDRAGSSA